MIAQKLSVAELGIRKQIITVNEVGYVLNCVESQPIDRLILYFHHEKTGHRMDITFTLKQSPRKVILAPNAAETILYIGQTKLTGGEEDIVTLFEYIQTVAKS